jgi:hypothetical protein
MNDLELALENIQRVARLRATCGRNMGAIINRSNPVIVGEVLELSPNHDNCDRLVKRLDQLTKNCLAIDLELRIYFREAGIYEMVRDENGVIKKRLHKAETGKGKS